MATTAAGATHRRRWSQPEKDACAEGVRRFGAFNHRRIAQLVGTRSRAQVRTYLYAAGYRKLGAAPFYTTVEPPPPPPKGTHVPFWSAAELAADDWTPPQRKAFEKAFARKMAARAAAADITSVNVVHGHGTVARRLLLRGEVFVDPCASYITEAPPADDRAVAYNDAHFRLRSDTRAAPSYYLNEARHSEPNVEWRVIDLGRPALGVVVLRDIVEKEELLLFYEAPD